MMDNDTIKTLNITYRTMTELLDREQAMVETLRNYLDRNPNYEFLDSDIYVTEAGNFLLKLRIQLTLQ